MYLLGTLVLAREPLSVVAQVRAAAHGNRAAVQTLLDRQGHDAAVGAEAVAAAQAHGHWDLARELREQGGWDQTRTLEVAESARAHMY